MNWNSKKFKTMTILGMGIGFVATGCRNTSPRRELLLPAGLAQILAPTSPLTTMQQSTVSPTTIPLPTSNLPPTTTISQVGATTPQAMPQSLPATLPPTVASTSTTTTPIKLAVADIPTVGAPTVLTTDPTAGAPQTIDLEAALSQAGVDNPTIALARERVRESMAQQLAARAMLLPSLTIGGNVHLHTGNLQRSPGTIMSVNSRGLYFGAGARSLAAESVAFPGVRLFAHLGDAVLEPQAARQHVAAKSAETQVVQNNTLLAVTTAYLRLVEADARLTSLKQAETELTELSRITKAYATAGQGREADANRALVNLELVTRQRQDAEGELVAASGRLAGLLSLDPSTRLAPIPGPLVPVVLINEDSDVEALINQALGARPERNMRAAEVAEAQTRVRQERIRPLLPVISAGYSAAGFGGGGDGVPYSFSHFSTRSDFDVMAAWTLQNFGVGNRALQRKTKALVGQSIAASIRTDNEIRAEVSEAFANIKAARAQLEAAKKSLISAEEGVTEEQKRIRSEVGRPLETLDSYNQLINARIALITGISAYNVAQFQLWVALGGTPEGTTTYQPTQ